jgi:hypothetical protein
MLILQQRWATVVILKYKKITDMLSVGPTSIQECIKAGNSGLHDISQLTGILGMAVCLFIFTLSYKYASLAFKDCSRTCVSMH